MIHIRKTLKARSRRQALAGALATLGAVTLAGLPTVAQAQAFPDKPMRIVVPFGAGGAV
jgi:tripartite-type tricarboxylate transporter receptor subunit TctC